VQKEGAACMEVTVDAILSLHSFLIAFGCQVRTSKLESEAEQQFYLSL
jgi:hypothetical protein